MKKVEVLFGDMKMFVTTSMNFEAAHELKSVKFTEEKNRIHYGKCTNLHGHNYKLFVTIQGEVKEDGMIVNFTEIKKSIRNKIIDIYDHSMINTIMDEVPTAENMVLKFWELLENEFVKLDVNLYEIKLHETENSYVTLRC